MKITKISLENFKGIGAKVEIPMSPITLLFGKNSAGKSTVLHALLYTQELLERLNVNADVLSGAGDGLDLGGFDSFLHKGSNKEGITIRYDLDFSGVNWESDYPVTEFLYKMSGKEIDLSDRGSDVQTGWIEMNIGPAGEFGQILIRKVEMGLGGTWVARFGIWHNRVELDDFDVMESPLMIMNEVHPLLALPGEENEPESGNIVGEMWQSLQSSFYRMFYSEDAVPGPLTEEQIEKRFSVDLKNCCRDDLRHPTLNDDHLRGVKTKVVPFLTDILEVAAVDMGRGKEIVIVNNWAPKSTLETLENLHESDHDRTKDILFNTINESYRVRDKEKPFRPKYSDASNPDFSSLDQIWFTINRSDIPDGDSKELYLKRKEFLQQLFRRFLHGPVDMLRKELARLRYIGPIRHIPSRAYSEQLSPSSGRWAKGLAAWDALFFNQSLCEKVSGAMSQHLGLRYSIQRKEYIELELDSEALSALKLLKTQYEELNQQFLAENVLAPLEALPKRRHVFLRDEKKGIQLKPHDVGVGLSQVIPVIVGAYAPDPSSEKGGILAVEQPELHVHPAVEVGLGDVFIEANRETGRMMLIETHSEHLLLRLLRRVRESSEQGSSSFTKDDLSVLYVVAGESGVEITEIPVTDDGDFNAPWPEGFFDERLEELM